MRQAVALCALLGSALLAPAATAAPRPVCRVVPDVAGDAKYGVVTPAGDVPLVRGTPGDDLLSADVASDGRRITAVFRMAAITSPDPVAPTGRSYLLLFDVAGAGTWFLSARTDPTGADFTYGDFVMETRVHAEQHVLGTARGRIDGARRTVTVDAPAAAFAGGLRRGSVLFELTASVTRTVGESVARPEAAGIVVPTTTGLKFDGATGNRYVVGTPSCVHPGI